MKFRCLISRTYTNNNGPCFALNDDQLEIQTTTSKFVQDEIIPVAAYHDRTGEYPMSILQKAWKLGLLNCHVPTKYGGLELDSVTGSIIAEELSYGCVGIQAALKVSEIAVSYPNL